MSVHNLKTLIKQKTCFKNPETPTCIDLILKNSPRSSQNSSVFETGLSDFNKLRTMLSKVKTESGKLEGLSKFPE